MIALTRAVLILAALTSTGSGLACSNSQSILQLFSKDGIWGKDFPIALAAMPSWTDIGESYIEVQPGRLVGSTRYRSESAIEPFAAHLRNSLQTREPEMLSRVEQALMKPYPMTIWKGQTALVWQGDSIRLALEGSGYQFLSQKLTMLGLRSQLGAPEKVSREVTRVGMEGRPEVIVIYSYCQGSVRFLESSYSLLGQGTSARLIERVILNLHEVTQALLSSR